MRIQGLLLISLVGLGAGCSQPDHVLFVTDSSIGINVDNEPPTVSVAYQRTEGYIGPAYQNGGLPPVVASIETGGTVFNPSTRQVYATGAAAVKAASAAPQSDGPKVLSGDATHKKLAFFGTSTTLGLKAGFGADGTPQNLVIGYNRKEASLVPLGSTTTNGVATDVYPSVLASIDTTITAVSMSNTGLSSKQFFATGEAAEELATNPAIAKSFQNNAADSVTATTLSPAERQAALAAGDADYATQTTRVTQIMNAVAPGGVLDSTKLGSLIDAANTKSPGSVPVALKTAATADELKKRIQMSQPITGSLFAALGS